MTEPVKHQRRVLANRAICDGEDHRDFADDPEHVTCEACKETHAREAADWHRKMTRQSRAARNAEPLDDQAPAAEPDQGERTSDVEE